MPMYQRFGTLLEGPFFENEQGQVQEYDPNLIRRGEPLPGDAIVYDVTARGWVRFTVYELLTASLRFRLILHNPLNLSIPNAVYTRRAYVPNDVYSRFFI